MLGGGAYFEFWRFFAPCCADASEIWFRNGRIVEDCFWCWVRIDCCLMSIVYMCSNWVFVGINCILWNICWTIRKVKILAVTLTFMEKSRFSPYLDIVTYFHLIFHPDKRSPHNRNAVRVDKLIKKFFFAFVRAKLRIRPQRKKLFLFPFSVDI